jgi:peptidoglycan/xylan/chitin deacetylase (PgdA/CDA1 family)
MISSTLLIKRSIKSAAGIARIGVSRAGAGSVNIIAYHRVVADIERAEREAIYGIVISAATFRRQCEMLRKAFDVVSLETAMHFLDDKRRVARPMAVITFDDGYADFYDEAFPVLNDLGLPATVFLPTGCIGREIPLAHDRIFWLVKQTLERSVPLAPALARAEAPKIVAKAINSLDLLKITDALVYLPAILREKLIGELEKELGSDSSEYPGEYGLLDWERVREMSRKGINFGSHTANHVVLPLEDVQTIRTEIFSSKAELEHQLGKKATTFAYPNGEYTPLIRDLTAEAGYRVAVTTENKINRAGADLLRLGRTSLCEESTRGIAGNFSQRVAGLRLRL